MSREKKSVDKSSGEKVVDIKGIRGIEVFE
jgi:hypothetical protein